MEPESVKFLRDAQALEERRRERKGLPVLVEAWQQGRFVPVRPDEDGGEMRLVDLARAERVCVIERQVASGTPDRWTIYRSHRGAHCLQRPGLGEELICLESCHREDLFGLLMVLTEEPAYWEALPSSVYARLRTFVEAVEI